MKCKYCGSEISASVKKCPFCEAPVNNSFNGNIDMNSTASISEQEKMKECDTKIELAHQETNIDNLFKTKELAAKIAGLGMKWYRVVLVLLIGDVVTCLGYSAVLQTGYIYLYEIGKSALTPGFIQGLYQAIPLLKFTDVFCGVLEIGFAFLSGIAFYLLKGFKKNAFKVLLLSYILPILSLLLRDFIKSICFNTFNSSFILGLITGLIWPVVFVIINYLYFKKRAFLFDQ